MINNYNVEIRSIKDEKMRKECLEKHLLFFKYFKSVKENKGVYGDNFYYIFDLIYKNKEYKIII